MNNNNYYDSDEFRTEIITQAYEYLMDGSSFRKVAKNHNISHVTLREHFIKYLPEIDYELALCVNEKKDERKEKSIEDPEIKLRVLKAYSLIMGQNMTINDIAQKLNSTPFTIYRDLTSRIHKLDFNNEDIELLKAKLVEHSRNNLNQNIRRGK